MKTCVEVVSYQLQKGVTRERYMPFVQQLQESVKEMEGFIQREVLYNEESGVWMEIIEWSSADAAKQAEAKLMQEPCMMEGMELIDQTTLQMHHLKQVL